MRVGGRGKPGCWFVIGRAAAGVEHDACVGQRQDDRVTVTDDVGAEYRPIEVPGSVLVGDHQELRDEQLISRRRGLVHHLSPLIGELRLEPERLSGPVPVSHRTTWRPGK